MYHALVGLFACANGPRGAAYAWSLGGMTFSATDRPDPAPELTFPTFEDLMYTDEDKAAIASEMTRIGIPSGQRLPLPANLNSAADYLAFLRAIPSKTGIDGFTAALSSRPDQSCR